MNGQTLFVKLDSVTALANRLGEWSRLVTAFQRIMGRFEHFQLELTRYQHPTQKNLLAMDGYWWSLDMSWGYVWRNECSELKNMLSQVNFVRNPHPFRAPVVGLNTGAVENELNKANGEIRNALSDSSVPNLRVGCENLDVNLRLRLQSVLNGIALESADLIQLVEEIKNLLAPPPASAVVVPAPPNP